MEMSCLRVLNVDFLGVNKCYHTRMRQTDYQSRLGCNPVFLGSAISCPLYINELWKSPRIRGTLRITFASSVLVVYIEISP
jgi:hypothetical protein